MPDASCRMRLHELRS